MAKNTPVLFQVYLVSINSLYNILERSAKHDKRDGQTPVTIRYYHTYYFCCADIFDYNHKKVYQNHIHIERMCVWKILPCQRISPRKAFSCVAALQWFCNIVQFSLLVLSIRRINPLLRKMLSPVINHMHAKLLPELLRTDSRFLICHVGTPDFYRAHSEPLLKLKCINLICRREL